MFSKKWYGQGVLLCLTITSLIAGIFFPARIRAHIDSLKYPFSCERITDLGVVPRGLSFHRISLFNAHMSSVSIEDANAGCGCTEVKILTNSVAPLSHGEVEVAISPSKSGRDIQTFTISTNRGKQYMGVMYFVK